MRHCRCLRVARIIYAALSLLAYPHMGVKRVSRDDKAYLLRLACDRRVEFGRKSEMWSNYCTVRIVFATSPDGGGSGSNDDDDASCTDFFGIEILLLQPHVWARVGL